MEKVNLNKVVYSKNQFRRVIDTNFSQLATSPTQAEIAAAAASPTVLSPSISIEQFFQYYNELFFEIPKEGETNSHEFLIKTSSEYIKFSPLNDEIQALIDEINILQQNNFDLNQQLVELQQEQQVANTDQFNVEE